MTDDTKPAPRIRINSVEIENFKGIDHLKLDFPPPLLDGDPDVTVIGSRNGVGKTSVLEACALALYFSTTVEKSQKIHVARRSTIEMLRRLVRNSSSEAIVNVCACYGDESIHFKTKYSPPFAILSPFLVDVVQRKERNWSAVRSILGKDQGSIFHHPIVFLGSYRRVLPGLATLSWILGDASGGIGIKRTVIGPDHLSGHDPFKRETFRLMIGRAGLFEAHSSKDAAAELDQLNQLTEAFAQCRIEQMRQIGEDLVDLRVNPLDGGPSYSFDSLSSGQKEIIATLFLVWKHTKDRPCVVFIDEPELHLNAEWHKLVVRELHRLAPRNQYILATHSSYVMGAVDPHQRVMLRADDGPDARRMAGD